MIKISIAEAGKQPQLLTFNKDVVSLGRAPDNDLRLTGKGVSGHHCRILRQGEAYVIEDAGSTNGTYVNRQRVAAPVSVSNADEIVVAVYKVKVLAEAAAGASPVPQGKAAVMGQAGAQILTSAPPSAGLPHAPADPTIQPTAAPPMTGYPPSTPSMPASGGYPPSTPSQPGTGRVPSTPSQPGTAYPPSTPSLHPSSSPSLPSSDGLTSSPSGSGPSPASIDPEDLEWGREWEQIDKIATAWLKSGKDNRHLLRGDKLKHARQWIARGQGKNPPPKPLHKAFIVAGSRARSLKVVANLTLGMLVLGGASAGGVYAWHRSQQTPDEVVEDKLDLGGEAGETGAEPQTHEPAIDRSASDAIAAKADGYVETDPQLATLIAMAALSKLPTDGASASRQAPATRVFRQAVLKLHGRPLRGHEGIVTHSSLSPDGRFAVTGSGDYQGVARLWDLSRAGVLTPGMLRGHSKPLTGMAIGSDGHFLVTTDADGLILRWDLTATDPPSTSIRLEDHGGPISAYDLSDDGRFLATGDEAGEIRVWNLADKRPDAQPLSGHTGPIFALDFDAAGTKLVSASDDMTGRIWRLSEGVPSGRPVLLEGHEVSVRAAALSPDGAWALTGGDDGRAILWNAQTRNPARTMIELLGHKKGITHAEITPNGDVAVTASRDNTLRTWELRSKDPMARVVSFEQHEGAIRSLVLEGPAAEATGLQARPTVSLSASADGTAQLWDLDKRGTIIDAKKFENASGEMHTAAISADGRRVLTGGDGSVARVWDAAATSGAGASFVARAHRDAVSSVAVNKSGTRMLSGGVDGTVRVWGIEPGREPDLLATLGDGASKITTVGVNPRGSFGVSGADNGTVRLWSLEKPGPKAFLPLAGHTSEIRGAVFSADEKWLATGSTDRTVRLWSMKSENPGENPIVLAHDDEVVSVAISGDSKWLMTASIRSAVLWKLTAKDPSAGSIPLGGHEDDVVSVALGPNGRWAATGGADRKAILRDLKTKDAEGIKLRQHDEPVRALAFSPAGRWLVTGDDGGALRLWDVESEFPDEGSILLAGHEKGIQAVAWSEDGTALVSAGNDSTIRVWPIGDGGLQGEPLVLRGHDQLVRSIALPSELEFIASGSYDGSARVWPLRPAGLVAIGCTRVGRDLTEIEWTEHVGGDQVELCAGR